MPAHSTILHTTYDLEDAFLDVQREMPEDQVMGPHGVFRIRILGECRRGSTWCPLFSLGRTPGTITGTCPSTSAAGRNTAPFRTTES